MEAVEVDVFKDFGEVDEVGWDGLNKCVLAFLEPLVEAIIKADHELGDEEFVLGGLVGEALVT